MKALLLALALLLIPTEASACDEGDQEIGPNCVHTEWLQHGMLKQEYTTLYRGDSRKEGIVWADFGTLESSELGHIEVYDPHGELNRFVWDPKARKYVWPR